MTTITHGAIINLRERVVCCLALAPNDARAVAAKLDVAAALARHAETRKGAHEYVAQAEAVFRTAPRCKRLPWPTHNAAAPGMWVMDFHGYPTLSD